MTNLANCRAIVTGGSAGLGLEIVKALAGRGAEVTAIARDPERLGAARDAGARILAGDATDAALIHRAVAGIAPDVLVLNAGARLPLKTIDKEDWEGFSAIWNTDVKATLAGVQAALNTPMRPGSRVLIMSSGAAMVMSHPAIEPRNLRLSGGYIGAKRMVWYMAHQAQAASDGRALRVRFQVLVPTQAIAGTELGHAVATVQAREEGLTIDDYMAKRYGPTLHPSQIGRQVGELLNDPRYETGVAYGFRADTDPFVLDL